MAKPKLNTSPVANTAIKPTDPTTTQLSTETSLFTTQKRIQRNQLVQETFNSLILISELLGRMDSIASRNTLSKPLHMWPDTSLKNYGAKSQNHYQHRTPEFQRSSNGLGKAVLSGSPISTLPTTSSYQSADLLTAALLRSPPRKDRPSTLSKSQNCAKRSAGNPNGYLS